jgi:O-antigen biosynthesis protein WbqV
MSIERKLSAVGRCIDSVVARISNVVGEVIPSARRSGRRTRGDIASVPQSYAILIFDSFVAFLSIFISIHLRIGMDFLDYSPAYILKNMLVFGLVSSSVFIWMQIHQLFWQYTTIEDLCPISLAVVLADILFFPLMLLMNREDFLPYSVLVINTFVLTLMLIIPRLLSRVLHNQRLKKTRRMQWVHSPGQNIQAENPMVLLVGSKESAEVFLSEIVSNDDITFNFDPIGILTFDPLDVGRVIRGVSIVGELRDIHAVLRTVKADGVVLRQIVITEKSIPENAKKFLVKYVKDHGLLLIHVIHQCMFDTVAE